MKNYLIVSVLVLIFLLQSCFGMEKKYKDEGKSYQESESQKTTSISEHKDEWIDNLYRNNEHKFRVEFPKGWTFGHGSGKNIVARGLQRDSGFVFSVLIRKIDDTNSVDMEVINRWDAWESNSVGNKMDKLLDDYKEKETHNVYFDGVHAKLTVSTHTKKAYDQILTYISHSAFCYKDGYIIQLTSILPELFYDESMDKKSRKFFESFVWEKAY